MSAFYEPSVSNPQWSIGPEEDELRICHVCCFPGRLSSDQQSEWKSPAPEHQRTPTPEVPCLASLWLAAIRWQLIHNGSFTQSFWNAKPPLNAAFSFPSLLEPSLQQAPQGSGEPKPQKLKIDQVLWEGAVTRTCALPRGCRLAFTAAVTAGLTYHLLAVFVPKTQ